MRITYLVQYYPPEQASGLQLVEDLLEGFANQGWTINLFTPSPTRGVTDEQRKKYKRKRIEKKYGGRLTIHRMHLYRERTGFISRAVRYIIFSVECFWKAATVPADVVFTGSGPPTQGVIAGLVKKVSKNKKIVYNLQDIFPDSLITSGISSKESVLVRIGRLMETFTYRNADVIITITDDMKDNLVRKGVDPEKVLVVRNWIDVKKIIPVEIGDNKLFDELGISRNKFNVIYAGNLGKAQGIDVIIEAAELLKDQNDIQFIIFGNGSEEDNVKKKAGNKSNISVFPLQPMERISEVYSMGNVAIIPCKPGTGSTGMPSKTWTIMAAGTAIIASFDLDSEMEKVINQAECGCCVESGNAELLADTISNMKNNTDLVNRMGCNARKFAEEHVAKHKAVQSYIEAIRDV